MRLIIAYILLIIVTLITPLIGVLKRKAILTFGEISFKNALSIKFWFNVMINPSIIGIFILCILMFILTLMVFSMLSADKVLIIGWTLVIPSFLITVVLNLYLLNEKFNYSKIPYVIILFISVAIGVYGLYGYLK